MWTNDILIKGHLWPMLQLWNNNSDNIGEATVVCIIRLIGKCSDIWDRSRQSDTMHI